VRNKNKKIGGLEKKRAISGTIDSLMVEDGGEVKNY